jgi:hypothetical protein
MRLETPRDLKSRHPDLNRGPTLVAPSSGFAMLCLAIIGLRDRTDGAHHEGGT